MENGFVESAGQGRAGLDAFLGGVSKNKRSEAPPMEEKGLEEGGGGLAAIADEVGAVGEGLLKNKYVLCSANWGGERSFAKSEFRT